MPASFPRVRRACLPPGDEAFEVVTSPPVVLVVDVANVMGSRPDGWWRDRAGAATRLMAELAPLAGAQVRAPDDVPLVVSRVLAVVEGGARDAQAPDGVEAVRATADGDSTILALAADLVAAGELVLVITADRGLRAALPAGTLVAGPRWLLDGPAGQTEPS
jgi:CBS domain-containing protein